MAFTLAKTGNGEVTFIDPSAPGQPYKARYKMKKRGARVWLYILFTKNAADLAMNLLASTYNMASIPVQVLKRNTSGVIVADPISLTSSMNCKIPLDVGGDADELELQILPSALGGTDVLKIGFSEE